MELYPYTGIPKIYIITLNHFYECCENPLAKHLFSELVQLRKEGYGPDYPKSFLPVDATDYFNWHHLYCIKENGHFIPVGAFRAVPLSRCDYYQQMIPLLKTAIDYKSKDHIEILESILEKNRAASTECVYSSGFTVKKKFRKERELASLIRELTAALTYLDTVEMGVRQYIGAAVLRFKVQNWYPDMGYQFLEKNGKQLAPIEKIAANNEKMLLIQMEKTSEWSKNCYEKHKNLIDERLWVGPKNSDHLNIHPKEPITGPTPEHTKKAA